MQAGALSNTFLALDGSTAYLTVTDKLWMKGAVTVEMTLHCAFTAWPASATLTLFGKDTVGPRLQISTAGVPSFASVRAGGTTTVTGTALTRGQEYVLTGKDDGTTVTLYVNGVSVATGTSQTGLLTTSSAVWYVGNDAADAALVAMRVYGFQLRLDGEVAGRWQPKAQLTATVPDLSQYANDAAVTGAANTGFYLASAWNDEPAWVGKGTI